MANITCIIGNGLDISLELNTTYKAFYGYVKKNKLHPNNSIYAAIEKQEPELWADFELGLGRFTNTIESVTEKERVKWSQTLNTELDEIKRDLKLYIQAQNERADEHIPNIKFTKRSLYSGLETGQESNIIQHIADGSQTVIRFVTLNYTNVLEKLFPHPGRTVAGQDYIVDSPIHHIHGSISRKISLGVNDETQLSSYIDTDEKNFLIKPELIRLMNDGRIEKLTELINVSDVTVLFGVSLGATDKYIWNKVIDWLNNYPKKLLIIHHYEHGLDVSDLTERESLLLSDRVKNKFLSYATLDDEDKVDLKSKIYVIPNTTDLFSIKKG
jgi:hypothetical protein